MRKAIFTICLLCLFLIGCSLNETGFEHWTYHRNEVPFEYDPFYPNWTIEGKQLYKGQPILLVWEKPGK